MVLPQKKKKLNVTLNQSCRKLLLSVWMLMFGGPLEDLLVLFSNGLISVDLSQDCLVQLDVLLPFIHILHFWTDAGSDTEDWNQGRFPGLIKMCIFTCLSLFVCVCRLSSLTLEPPSRTHITSEHLKGKSTERITASPASTLNSTPQWDLRLHWRTSIWQVSAFCSCHL